MPKRLEFSGLTLAQCAWAFPLAGAVTGALTAFIYLILLALGVAHGLAGWVALAFLVILTGGLHEDGLADTADGLASGRDREEKLAIMHDSRIGSYGVIALIIILGLRAQTMGSFGSGLHTVLAFMAAGAASRSCIAVMMRMLPPAKADGLAASAGRPNSGQMQAALWVGLGFLMLLGLRAFFLGVLIIAATHFLLGRTAMKHFGGITGDVLGAAQQVSEVALLVALS